MSSQVSLEGKPTANFTLETASAKGVNEIIPSDRGDQLPNPMQWREQWFGDGVSNRKLVVKGLTKWEVLVRFSNQGSDLILVLQVLEGYDVVGEDLEAIADKNMAISECFFNIACKGFVWSEAQGQAYLKTGTRTRQMRKKELKLSLYLRAFDAFRSITVEGEIVKTKTVSNSDDAKEHCETMKGCRSFTIDDNTVAKFYSRCDKFVRINSPLILYKQLQVEDFKHGISPAELLGQQDVLSPRDISKDPPIVVGGTDGSGTRAVVTLLSNLNVLMVKDDACTFDVHAGEMGGWPPVVRRALRHSRSANYSVDQIPENDRAYLRRSIRVFADKMVAEAKRFSLMKRHARWG